VSDIAQIKTLDGRRATFLRFEGTDKYVVDIEGDERTITRDEWRRLQPHQPRVVDDEAFEGNLDRLGQSADCVAAWRRRSILDHRRADWPSPPAAGVPHD
jgi:hypothetical protein